MKNCILMLTCATNNEADQVTQLLLEKKLIICAKKTPVSSSFLWQGKQDKAGEILLIMDSIEEYFKKIEVEVRKVHSYETFVLISLPVTQTTKAVEDWMRKELT